MNTCVILKSHLRNQRKPGFVTIVVLRMMKMKFSARTAGYQEMIMLAATTEALAKPILAETHFGMTTKD
jgi:hypothetical protein